MDDALNTATEKLKPRILAPTKVKKMPSCAAAPSSLSLIHIYAQQGGSAQYQQPQLKGLGVKIRFQLFGCGVQRCV